MIAEVFFDINLGMGHRGLAELSKNSNAGYIVFINRKKSAFKVLSTKNVVAYFKPDSGKIDLNMIRDLPKYFDKGMSGYNQTLKKHLEAKNGKIHST